MQDQSYKDQFANDSLCYQPTPSHNKVKNKTFFISLLAILSLAFATSYALAGGRSGETNLMDSFIASQVNISTPQPAFVAPQMRSARSFSALGTQTIDHGELVFKRSADAADNEAFNSAFALSKTLTNIRHTSGGTQSTDAALLGSLLDTFNTPSTTHSGVVMPLQVRNNELALKGRFLSDTGPLVENGMLPTAVFNRFDLSAADGRHCGEYRVVYHNNTGGGPFFLIFEAQYPNPQAEHGIAGCYAVADFWQSVGQMSRQEALVALEQFFYQGLEHEGVALPAVINFAHYQHATGQVRSNAFVDSPWQLREFKTAIDTDGKPIFVADTVKDNPFTRLFAEQSSTDTAALNTLRDHFNEDISLLIDNLLSPERRIDNPDASSIINGFHLGNSDQFNEFQSDSSGSDNTAAINNAALDAMIQSKLDAEGLAFYTPAMIRNRAEAMSCGGCHQNSTFAEVAPNVRWPNSGFFVHVSTRGNLSPALTEQFLPARKRVLEHYLQNTDKPVNVPKWRFAEMDYTTAHSDFNAVYNAPNQPNPYAFAALKPDGSITAWGHYMFGGRGAPTDTGYVKIYSNSSAFAALTADGAIRAWGYRGRGGSGAPTDNGYTKIYSTPYAFAALKSDGSITAWGLKWSGGVGAPTDSGYVDIYSNSAAFTALKEDGSITAWGYEGRGGSGAPTDTGYIKITSTRFAFAALNADGTITSWGNINTDNAPTDSGYVDVYSTSSAFAALKTDGSIVVWGDKNNGGAGAPIDDNYTKIAANAFSFLASKDDGSMSAWGIPWLGGSLGDVTQNGYEKIAIHPTAYAIINIDGSITAWGNRTRGGSGAPTDNGYTNIYANQGAFAALKADGSIATWGNAAWGGAGGPTDSGYIGIYSNNRAFVAFKADGTLSAWGQPEYGGSGP